MTRHGMNTGLGIVLWILLTTTIWGIERQYLEMLVGNPTGFLPWELREMSGLAHCRTTPNQLWAINDRGNKAIIHALSLKAELLNSYPLSKDSSNKDWEDLACGRCANSAGECLYIGDIGNNQESRKKIKLYMVPLPLQFEETATGKTVIREKFSLKYPNGKYNAEALLVHPEEPIVLIATKEKRNPKHSIDPKLYIANLALAPPSKKMVLESAGTLPIFRYLTNRDPPASAWVTGGDFYPSGKWFIIMTYTHLYRTPWPLPANASDRIMLPIWENANRKKIESIAFHRNGKQFWIGSEIICTSCSKEPLLLMGLPLQ